MRRFVDGYDESVGKEEAAGFVMWASLLCPFADGARGESWVVITKFSLE